jgi:hypothetical protein
MVGHNARGAIKSRGMIRIFYLGSFIVKRRGKKYYTMPEVMLCAFFFLIKRAERTANSEDAAS